MQKSAQTLCLTQKCNRCIFDSPLFWQSTRWRMRRWAPINPSKKFFVPKRPPVDTEEMKELILRTNEYKTSMRALMKHFKQLAAEDIAPGIDEKEEESIRHKNEMWNRDTALLREARMKAYNENLEERRLRMTLQLEEEQRSQREFATSLVLKEQKQSKKFISEENMQREIESALDSKVTYNFTIDIEGNRYVEMPDGQLTVENEGQETESNVWP